MAEEIIPQPKFESGSPLETDIDRLAGEVARHKENPEMQGVSGQEIVKQAIRALSPAPANAPAVSDEAVSPGMPNYMAGAPPAIKLEVEHLVELAFKEGIAKAAREAASSNSPFVLDAFHDALAGKLYPELQRRKLVD